MAKSTGYVSICVVSFRSSTCGVLLCILYYALQFETRNGRIVYELEGVVKDEYLEKDEKLLTQRPTLFKNQFQCVEKWASSWSTPHCCTSRVVEAHVCCGVGN